MFEECKSLIEAAGKELGWSDSTSNLLTICLVLFILLSAILKLLWNIVKHMVKMRHKGILNHDLSPYYSSNDVSRATKYYIDTKYQNVAPSEDDEPGRKYIAAAKNKLIPLFINQVFKRGNNSNKFFLILADSGMGKTTFMINLYIKYKSKVNLSFSLPKFEIKLLPLGAKEVFKEIEKIENKYNTILLLDAFDEDIQALDNYEKRMKELIKITEGFRAIVISCRTQFFPSQHEEPHETGYFTFGGDSEHKFQKLYLSVFSDNDINSYLWRRFGILKLSKYLKARQIVKQCPNLMVRPMLLGHIEDLVNHTEAFSYAYQIYKHLIQKWIERESEKPGITEKFSNPRIYQKLLLNFSQKLAKNFYNKRKKRGGYFISNDTPFEIEDGLSLSEIEQQETSLSEREGRSRSLLNRNAIGQYKFSHKSILEYFLVMEMLCDSSFLYEFDFNGMDMAYSFYRDMVVNNDFTTPNVTSRMKFSISGTADDPQKRVGMLGNYVEVYSHTDLIKLSRIKELRSIYYHPAKHFVDYLNIFLDFHKAYHRISVAKKNRNYLNIIDKVSVLKLENIKSILEGKLEFRTGRMLVGFTPSENMLASVKKIAHDESSDTNLIEFTLRGKKANPEVHMPYLDKIKFTHPKAVEMSDGISYEIYKSVCDIFLIDIDKMELSTLYNIDEYIRCKNLLETMNIDVYP